MSSSLRPVGISGLGRYVPERKLTNQELEGMVDTSDEWIVQRTGIRERRIAGDGEVTSTSPSLAWGDMQPGQSGAYTVWVDAGLCDTPVSEVINVTVNTQPETPELTPSTAIACAGSALSFTTSADADDYLWTGPNGYTSSAQNPPAARVL